MTENLTKYFTKSRNGRGKIYQILVQNFFSYCGLFDQYNNFRKR